MVRFNRVERSDRVVQAIGLMKSKKMAFWIGFLNRGRFHRAR